MNIGFIGTGKISSAVVEAICSGTLEDVNIFVSPRNEEKSRSLAERFENVTRAGSNQEVIDNSEIVFIALKTDIYEDVLSGLSFREDQKIVSFIPFSTCSKLRKLVSPAANISRATPLPTVVNHICPIQFFNAGPEVSRILGSIGQLVEVETEEALHAIWTLTCLISPYYDLMAEVSEWAVTNSVNSKVANKYVADMFNSLAYAAGRLDHPDFKALSSHAATPGGLNEWAAKSIAESGAHGEYIRAATHIFKMFGND